MQQSNDSAIFMLKKHKRILIAVCVSVLLLTLLLLLLSLCRLYVGEYGLNYNAITASFSDSNVYEPGLYLIGIANSFLRVKSQEIIHLSNLTGYSSDFFQLNADFEITYSVDLSQTNANFTNFTVLSQFYILFGNDPFSILQPLAKNIVVNVISQYSQNHYLLNSSVLALEKQIEDALIQATSVWSPLTFTVLIESIVCQGIQNYAETTERRIQYLSHILQQVSNQKVELDSYLALLKTQKTLQYDSAHTMIADKMAKLGGLLSVYGDTAKSIPQLVYSNMPIRYYTNYLNVLEQLVAIGNQTFPY